MQNPREISIDIVIIGAGPAGLSLALHLLSRDPSWAHRLVILEKETHPRPKPCGGGITGFGLTQLQSLGLTLNFPFIPVETAELRYRYRVVRIHGEPIFVVTHRSAFDAWLADKARAKGIHLHEKNPVIGIERHEDRLLVRTPNQVFVSKAIVGADGARGFVRRWVGARERPARIARVLKTIIPSTGHEKEFTRRLASFDFSAMRSHLQGYIWRFPSLVDREPFLNIGIYDSRVDGRAPKAQLPALLDKNIQLIDGNSPMIPVSHPIRWFSPRNRISDRNVILVGDAAGVDPLFGEGISVSLAYGQVAADYLGDAFLREKFDFSDYKRKVILSSVGRYLLLRWLIASIITPLIKSDLIMHGVWSLLGLLAIFINPSTELPYRTQFDVSFSSE